MEDFDLQIDVGEVPVSFIRTHPAKDGCRVQALVVKLGTGPVIDVETGDRSHSGDPFPSQHHRPDLGGSLGVSNARARVRH
ncbi:hypothetical protein D3C81_1564080 [compost metagenome]